MTVCAVGTLVAPRVARRRAGHTCLFFAERAAPNGRSVCGGWGESRCGCTDAQGGSNARGAEGGRQPLERRKRQALGSWGGARSRSEAFRQWAHSQECVCACSASSGRGGAGALSKEGGLPKEGNAGRRADSSKRADQPANTHTRNGGGRGHTSPAVPAAKGGQRGAQWRRRPVGAQ